MSESVLPKFSSAYFRAGLEKWDEEYDHEEECCVLKELLFQLYRQESGNCVWKLLLRVLDNNGRNIKWDKAEFIESESHPVVSESLRPDPMGYRVHGILQARILEWVAYPFSRGSSRPRNRTGVSCIVGGFFTS